MIVNPDLAEWLGSAARQSSTKSRFSVALERWHNQPLFTDTAKSLRSKPDASIDDILDIARNFIARPEELQILLADLIAEAADDPFFRPPLTPVISDIGQGFVLLSHRNLMILLNVINADALAAKKINTKNSSLGFTGMVALHHYIKGGNATLSLWEAPQADAAFSGGTSGALRKTGICRLQDGDSWIVDGRRESFIIEHAETDIVQIQALVRVNCAPLAAEYDIRTGAYVGASATDESSSRTEMMVTLLRLMGRDEAWPVVEQLLDNPHFFTRWYLMREFLALNGDAALPHLIRMAESDPHPELRAAATETLSMFFPSAAGDR